MPALRAPPGILSLTEQLRALGTPAVPKQELTNRSAPVGRVTFLFVLVCVADVRFSVRTLYAQKRPPATGLI